MEFKKIIKQIVYFVILILELPVILICWMENLFGINIMFTTFAQLFSLVPGIVGIYIRKVYYNTILEKSEMAFMLFGTIISDRRTRIGEGVGIGAFAIIGYCEIGAGAGIGNSAHILSGKKMHVFGPQGLDLSKPMTKEKVHIGAGTWIGNHSVIMANVGNNCLIGAGSVVNKEIEDGVLAAGNPARVIKKL